MSHLWLGHSLAEVGGQVGTYTQAVGYLLGTPFGSPTPLVAENKKSKCQKWPLQRPFLAF